MNNEPEFDNGNFADADGVNKHIVTVLFDGLSLGNSSIGAFDTWDDAQQAFVNLSRFKGDIYLEGYAIPTGGALMVVDGVIHGIVNIVDGPTPERFKVQKRDESVQNIVDEIINMLGIDPSQVKVINLAEGDALDDDPTVPKTFLN